MLISFQVYLKKVGKMEDLLQEDNRSLDLENQNEENVLKEDNSSNCENQEGIERNNQEDKKSNAEELIAEENTAEKVSKKGSKHSNNSPFEEYFRAENKRFERENGGKASNFRDEEKEKKEGALSVIITIVLAILCVALVFVKFVWLYCVVVDGDSMNATLQTGDYLLVDRLAEIDRGDVIVFTLEKAYIKRAVALEGDTVRIENGNLYVKKAGESKFELVEYEGVLGKTYYNSANHGKVFEQVISKGCIFALGDNREHSTDSRILGEISVDKVNGVVHQFVIDKKDGRLGKLYKYV